MSVSASLGKSLAGLHSLTGKLQSLGPDIDAPLDTDGTQSRIILTIKDSSGFHLVSVESSKIRATFTGIIDSLSLANLFKGKPLPAPVAEFINNGSIIVKVELAANSNFNSNATLQGTSIAIDNNSTIPTPTNKQYGAPGKPVATEWPSGELPSLFTPVRVPFSDFEKVRIGYAILDVPINYISHTRTSRLEEVPVMRQSSTLKRGAGTAYETFTFNYIAQGSDSIRRNVQEVLEQINLFPFITVEGGLFGPRNEAGDVPYHAIAIKNITVSTLDNLPDALAVEISADPFNWEWFTPPSEGLFPRYELDDMICWPLFKIWAKTRQRSRFHNHSLGGKLIFSFPSPYMADKMDALLAEDDADISGINDTNALLSLKNGLIPNDHAQITSKNALELLPNTAGIGDQRFFVLKLSDPNLWRELVPWVSGTGSAGKTISSFYGLVDWRKFANVSGTDEDGNRLPRTSFIDLNHFHATWNNGQPIRIVPNDKLSILDIGGPDQQLGTLNDQINNSNLSDAEKAARIAAPWNYYGIVLGMTKQDGDRLSRTIGDMAARSGVKSDVTFKSTSRRLKELFEPEVGQTIVLDNNPNSQDIIVEKISGTRGYNLSLISTHHDPLPVHQYMGGVDATFIIQGKCFGPEAKKRLEAIKAEFDLRSLFKLQRKFVIDGKETRKAGELGSAFLNVDNEIFQLLGVDFVIPVTITFQTLDGFPDIWDWSMTCLEYDPKTLKSEQIKFLPTTMDNYGKVYNYGRFSLTREGISPIKQRAEEWFSLQDSLASQEVYTDMALPNIAEMRYWINICIKAAKEFQNSKSRIEFTATEIDIKKHIDEFLPFNAKDMVGWSQTLTNTNIPPDIGAYCDPDWFCYYDHSQQWGNIFDSLSEQLMGKPDGDLSATGTTSDVQSGFRLYDPENGGIRSTFSKSFWASDPNQTQKMLDQVTHYPEDKYNEVRKAYRDIDAKFGQTRGKWWDNTIVQGNTPNPNDPNSLDLNDLETAARDSMIIPHNLTEGQLDDQGLLPVDTEDLSEYFHYSWRQKEAQAVAEKGASTAARFGAGTSGPVFLFDQSVFNKIKADSTFFKSPDTATIEELETWIDANITDEFSNLTTETVSKLTADDGKPLASKYPLSFWPTPNFLERTAKASSDYSYWANRSAPANPNLNAGSLSERIANSWDYINWVSAKNNIDPNIVRAFFLRRDNFGVNVPDTSTTERGFAQMDPRVGNISDNAVTRINLFVSLLATNMGRFNHVPSIALLATNLQVTTHGIDFFVDPTTQDLKKTVIEDLQSTSSALAGMRSGPEAVRKLNTTMHTYDANNNIGAYYTAYLSLCRTYGSVWNPNIIPSTSYDPFFYPFSIPILMDDGDNQNKYLNLKGPDGSTIKADLNRTAIDGRLASIKEYGTGSPAEKGTLDQQIRYDTKLKSAMEPSSEAAIYGSLVDLRKHSMFGRLCGAFPAYQVILINEGWYWLAGNTKLWDQFYTRTGVSEIEIFKTRYKPGSSCSITFSNMFYSLTSYAQIEALQHQIAQSVNKRMAGVLSNPFTTIAELFNNTVLKTPSDDLLRIWQTNHLKQLAMHAGVRVQVRMGYGSNASSLPIVFNGGVVDAPVSEGYVTLLCAGDGDELEKPSTRNLVQSGNAFAYQDGGAFATGKDPSSIITECIIGVGLWDNITYGNFRDFSAGVAHFGEVYFTGAFTHYPAEMQINIYSSNSTHIEQGIPTIQNYFNTAALYNWNDSNLFSVEVFEATPWKVMEVCRRACLDHVASAEVFANRSTVFFGKWWWPYNYTYDASIMEVNDFSNFVGVTLPKSNFTISALPTDNGPVPVLTNLNNSPDGSKSTNQALNIPKPGHSIPDSTPNQELEALKMLGVSSERDHSLIDPSTLPKPVLEKIALIINGQNRKAAVDSVRAYKNNQDITSYSIILTDWTTIVIDYYPDGTALIVDQNSSTPATIPTSKYPKGTKRDPVNGTPVNPADPTTTPQSPSGVDLQLQTSAGSDFLKDVDYLVQFLKWKTYMQAYIAHTGINLLNNEIHASSEKVFTDAIGRHKYNGYLGGESMVRTINFSVDTAIQPSDRKTMEVETGLLVTGMQSGLVKPLEEAVLPFVPLVGSTAKDYIQQTPTTPAVENGVVSALVDSVKEMYQGWFTITGQPTMKPRDLVLLTDVINDLKGPVFVKEVIHRMDSNTGFTTMVKPDAVVFPHSSLLGEQLVTSLSAGILRRLGAFYIYKAVTASIWGGLIKGAYGKKNSLLTVGELEQYNRIQQLAKERLNGANITEQLRADLADQIHARYAARRDANVASKRTQVDKDKNNAALDRRELEETRKIDSMSTSELQKFAVDKGYKIEITDVSGVSKFELDAIQMELKLSAAEIAEIADARAGKLLPGFNLDEVIRGIRVKYNNQRAAFIRGHQALADEVTINTDSATIQNLKKQIGELVEKLGISSEHPGLDTRFLNPEFVADDGESLRLAKKRLRKLINQLSEAVSRGDTTTIGMDAAIRKLVNEGNLHLVDGDIEGFVTKVLRETFGSTTTLIDSAARGTTVVGRAATNAYAEFVKAIGEAKSRIDTGKGSAVWPTGKINLRLKVNELKERFASWALDAKKADGTPWGAGFVGNLTKAGEEVKNTEKAAAILNRVRRMALIRSVAAFEDIKKLYTGARLLKYMGPQAALSVAVDTAIFIIFGSLIEGLNARLRARRCVKIIPLMAGTVPYTAGIRGHQGSVIGDDPSWADQLISGWLTPTGVDSNNVISHGASVLTGWMAALSGVEVPDWSTHESDSQYIAAMQK